MIDFKRADLYKKEKTRKDLFLEKKLVTSSEQAEEEYTKQLGVNKPQEVSEFLGGNTLDIDGLNTEDFGMGEDDFNTFGGAGDRSGVKDNMDWKMEGQPVQTFFMAPLFLIRYIFTDIVKDFPNKKEWKTIIKYFNVGNMISISLAIIELAVGINNIFSPKFQLVAGLVMFIITTTILKVVYNEDTYITQMVKRLVGKEEDDEGVGGFGDFGEQEGLEEGGDFGDIQGAKSRLEAIASNMGVDTVGGEGYVEGGDTEEDSEEDSEEVSEGIVDEVEDEDEEVIEQEVGGGEGGGRLALPPSRISTDSNEIFSQDLLNVFRENNKYKGREIQGRVDLIKSFSDYLIQNDTSFGKWVRPKERGIEYNNITYSLFKGLSRIEQQFGRYTEELVEVDRMVVVDIRKSPLLYRIELELPSYFTERKITRQMKIIEDVLRKSEDDTEVSVIMTSFRGNFVFKFLRLDSKTLVSLGDMLRFYDEDKGYAGMAAYDDEDIGLPVLFGLQNNEFPYIVDMEANTSGVIVGGSNSGKSWATFEIMLNIVTTNDYNNVNFIILDAKNAPFWNSFARLPHVLGYHTDPMEYFDILTEVEEERARRQELLGKVNYEDVRGYRKSMRKAGKIEELNKLPLLYVVIDEVTATMGTLRTKDEKLYNAVRDLMGIISQQGRSAGVRILAIGQRSTDDSIPKSLMANASFKFGMKMNVENDFGILLGDGVKNYTYPSAIGMGLAQVEGVMGLNTVKTLTVGGRTDEQMLMLVRVVAFEWVRRSYGRGDFTKQPEGMNFSVSFNRNKYYTKSVREMKEGRILSVAEVNKGYEVDLDGGENGLEVEDVEYKEVEDEHENSEKEVYGQESEDEKIENSKEENDEKNSTEGTEQEFVGSEEVRYREQGEENLGREQEEKEDKEEREDVSTGGGTGLGGIDWGAIGSHINMDNEENVEIDKSKEREEIENVGEYVTGSSEIEDEGEKVESKEWEEEKVNIEDENDDGALSLEGILGIGEVSGEADGEVGGEQSGEVGSEKKSEEVGEVKEEKRNKGEIIRNKGEKEKTSGGSQKDHYKDHHEDHLKILDRVPVQEHVITRTIWEDGRKGVDSTETEESKKEEIYKELEKRLEEIKRIELRLKERERELGQERQQSENIKREEKTSENNWGGESSQSKEVKKDKKEKIKVEQLQRVEDLGREDETGSKQDVEVNYAAQLRGKKEEPKMSIKQYVASYGQARGFNVYITKEELEKVYNKETIEKSLSRMAIVETGDSYMTKL